MTLENLYWTMMNITDNTDVIFYNGNIYERHMPMSKALEDGVHGEDEIARMRIKCYENETVISLAVYY